MSVDGTIEIAITTDESPEEKSLELQDLNNQLVTEGIEQTLLDMENIDKTITSLESIFDTIDQFGMPSTESDQQLLGVSMLRAMKPLRTVQKLSKEDLVASLEADSFEHDEEKKFSVQQLLRTVVSAYTTFMLHMKKVANGFDRWLKSIDGDADKSLKQLNELTDELEKRDGLTQREFLFKKASWLVMDGKVVQGQDLIYAINKTKELANTFIGNREGFTVVSQYARVLRDWSANSPTDLNTLLKDYITGPQSKFAQAFGYIPKKDIENSMFPYLEARDAKFLGNGAVIIGVTGVPSHFTTMAFYRGEPVSDITNVKVKALELNQATTVVEGAKDLCRIVAKYRNEYDTRQSQTKELMRTIEVITNEMKSNMSGNRQMSFMEKRKTFNYYRRIISSLWVSVIRTEIQVCKHLVNVADALFKYVQQSMRSA